LKLAKADKTVARAGKATVKAVTKAAPKSVSLTAQKPYNNVVRTSLKALAPVLCGPHPLHTNPLDETYSPGEAFFTGAR
jgi:methylmalonyl-CoA mutase N-terminal domain/subunit